MVSLQFGSTSTLSNSAAAAAPAQVPVDASEEVDTVGWGSTTVGTLLRAKVGVGSNALPKREEQKNVLPVL